LTSLKSLAAVAVLGFSAPALSAPLAPTQEAEGDAPTQEVEGDAPPIELPKVRHVALLPTVGVWRHGFRDNGLEGELGPVWGFFARIEPWEFLHIRAGVLRGDQPVRITQGSLAAPDSGAYQPPLEILRFAARAEPRLTLLPALDLYLGAGLGWSRSVVPELVTSRPRLESAPRNSVALVPGLAVGASYEPVGDWLLVTAEFGASWLISQSGSALQPIQAFSQDGHRTELGGLPRFAECLEVLVGLGLIL